MCTEVTSKVSVSGKVIKCIISQNVMIWTIVHNMFLLTDASSVIKKVTADLYR